MNVLNPSQPARFINRLAGQFLKTSIFIHPLISNALGSQTNFPSYRPMLFVIEVYLEFIHLNSAEVTTFANSGSLL